MDRPQFRRLGTMQLMTQQLRLRNLTKITIMNIETGDQNGLVYFTLHYNKDDSDPIYTSEALPQHMQQKWAEIYCPEILKSNKNCICVKVWLRPTTNEEQHSASTNGSQMLVARTRRHQIKESYRALDTWRNLQNSSTDSVQPNFDKLLFTWGIYFSGLVMLNHRNDIQFNKNALVLQMNGVNFCSPDYFFFSNITEQPAASTYQRATYSSSSASISASPDPYLINSPRVSRSSSPIVGDYAKNTPPEKLTERLFQITCQRSEIRRSYDLKKLLRIQDTQRQRMQMMRKCAEIIDDIKHQSVRCITKDQLKRPGRRISSSYSSSGIYTQTHVNHYHSMGRTLSKLLAEEEQIEPASLLRAQKLQQELEAVRFRNGLLVNERKTFRDRLLDLQKKLASIDEERSQIQRCLSLQIAELEKEKVLLDEQYQHHRKRLQLRRNVVHNVEKRMSILCLELQEIYPIRRNENGFYTICGVPFPSLDSLMHSTRNANSGGTHEQISPLALSASLGYVAHLVLMISVIIDQPLRNPIIHEGSRSRMQDTIKNLPHGPKEYPLYSRSLIPSKFVKYALFLLNQNIAQLCYDITGIQSDLRATIENLIKIFGALAEIEQSLIDEDRPLRSHPVNRNYICTTSSSNGSIKKPNSENFSTDEIDALAQSLSSIDEQNGLSHPSNVHLKALLSAKASQPLAIAERSNVNQEDQRVSRSVGSCSADEGQILNNIYWRPYSSSDSNIALRCKKT